MRHLAKQDLQFLWIIGNYVLLGLEFGECGGELCIERFYNRLLDMEGARTVHGSSAGLVRIQLLREERVVRFPMLGSRKKRAK